MEHAVIRETGPWWWGGVTSATLPHRHTGTGKHTGVTEGSGWGAPGIQTKDTLLVGFVIQVFSHVCWSWAVAAAVKRH